MQSPKEAMAELVRHMSQVGYDRRKLALLAWRVMHDYGVRPAVLSVAEPPYDSCRLAYRLFCSSLSAEKIDELVDWPAADVEACFICDAVVHLLTPGALLTRSERSFLSLGDNCLAAYANPSGWPGTRGGRRG
jgi:hypothetical protein